MQGWSAGVVLEYKPSATHSPASPGCWLPSQCSPSARSSEPSERITHRAPSPPTPPTCLVQLASTHGDPASSEFLEAVISTGSLELVEPNSRSLVVGAKADWASELTRPPGLPRIWAAIVSAPPDDSKLLVDLATSAESHSHASSEGLALIRLFSQRTNATPNAKAQAASVLARRYSMLTEAQRLLDKGGATALSRWRHH
jgi:hypothetical protein